MQSELQADSTSVTPKVAPHAKLGQPPAQKPWNVSNNAREDGLTFGDRMRPWNMQAARKQPSKDRYLNPTAAVTQFNNSLRETKRANMSQMSNWILAASKEVARSSPERLHAVAFGKLRESIFNKKSDELAPETVPTFQPDLSKSKYTLPTKVRQYHTGAYAKVTSGDTAEGAESRSAWSCCMSSEEKDPGCRRIVLRTDKYKRQATTISIRPH